MTPKNLRGLALSFCAAMALACLSMGDVRADASNGAALQAAVDYVKSQKTTGFLVIQDGQVLTEQNWSAPLSAAQFKTLFTYGTNEAGELLEDVASQQKSFIAMLVGIAVDKGLVDVTQPVSTYIGTDWSKATTQQEAQIRVADVLTMSSGLTPEFTYSAPPGSVFYYNTPVYAVTKRILEVVARQPLETLTTEWLTAPAGMKDTSWRKRPAAFGDVGNPTGLVTSPRDVATFGQIVLAQGRAANGRQIISPTQLNLMFVRSAANPAYGRLWWLNGSEYAIHALDKRVEGPLIPSAPSDLVVAIGFLDRKLYISPSRKLVVVRMGQAVPDQKFDEHLWELLSKALNSLKI